jgi:ComF family protein
MFRVLREYVSWIYPYTCELCGQGGLDHLYICEDCEKELPHIEPPLCSICGEPFFTSCLADTRCRVCKETPPDYQEARAAYLYSGELRDLLLKLKYHGAIHLAATFAELMANAWDEHPYWFGSQPRIIVPVPMYSKKRQKRGYNQAAEIAKALAHLADLPYLDILLHMPDKIAQASLNRAQRLKHSKLNYSMNSSKLRKKPLDGADILLIDDVLTTGSTANVCTQKLLQAGAASVCVFTLARSSDLGAY